MKSVSSVLVVLSAIPLLSFPMTAGAQTCGAQTCSTQSPSVSWLAHVANGDAIHGDGNGTGTGVQGGTSNGTGVGGIADNSGNGVVGSSVSGYGVAGTSTSGAGVYGTSSSANGVLGSVASSTGNGVQGSNSAASASGVYASSSHCDGYALAARNSNSCTSATGAGVYIDASAAGASTGVWGLYQYGSGARSRFEGSLSKPAGSFEIDHPLDPANKLLYHSFVESPDMKNIYDGIAVLDVGGNATIVLPNWFQPLNRDFRYQLTCIGSAAPVYVSQEITNNTFKISGGTAGLKVSWQVTGIRHDAFARMHRIKVEVDKPLGDRGRYLHPVELGFSVDAGTPNPHVPDSTYVDPVP